MKKIDIIILVGKDIEKRFTDERLFEFQYELAKYAKRLEREESDNGQGGSDLSVCRFSLTAINCPPVGGNRLFYNLRDLYYAAAVDGLQGFFVDFFYRNVRLPENPDE